MYAHLSSMCIPNCTLHTILHLCLNVIPTMFLYWKSNSFPFPLLHSSKSVCTGTGCVWYRQYHKLPVRTLHRFVRIAPITFPHLKIWLSYCFRYEPCEECGRKATLEQPYAYGLDVTIFTSHQCDDRTMCAVCTLESKKMHLHTWSSNLQR